MANEIRGVAPTGSTLYARIANSSGNYWNGSAFEAYSAGNYSTYDVAMTEQGASGVYTATFPSGITSAGTYEYFVHLQAGGSPAEGDLVANTGKVDWSGSASVTASSSAMTGSDFYAYLLRKGFKRTDKSTEAYEAITDAIQEMRMRFGFDEAQTDATTTDTISTLGDYKLTNESDMGMLHGVIVQDGADASQLLKISKARYDELYPYQAVSTHKGYPSHYCVYAGQIYIGPIPDSVDYTYRLNYSKRAGAITSSTSGVPFTDLYRDILCQLSISYLWDALDEEGKADRCRQKFEGLFELAQRKERKNAGEGVFNMNCQDF
jgi:hypothetical protein